MTWIRLLSSLKLMNRYSVGVVVFVAVSGFWFWVGHEDGVRDGKNEYLKLQAQYCEDIIEMVRGWNSEDAI